MLWTNVRYIARARARGAQTVLASHWISDKATSRLITVCGGGRADHFVYACLGRPHRSVTLGAVAMNRFKIQDSFSIEPDMFVFAGEIIEGRACAGMKSRVRRLGTRASLSFVLSSSSAYELERQVARRNSLQ